MRTALSIDDDVLAAAKALAAQQHKTVGEIISSLSRQALCAPVVNLASRNGIPLLPITDKSRPVTLETVNRLRDELI